MEGRNMHVWHWGSGVMLESFNPAAGRVQSLPVRHTVSSPATQKGTKAGVVRAPMLMDLHVPFAVHPIASNG